jgi:hypothetical protein
MSGPPGVDKPTVADEVVQQVKNSSPPAAGNRLPFMFFQVCLLIHQYVAGADGEEGKLVFRRPGKSRRKTRYNLVIVRWYHVFSRFSLGLFSGG